MKKSIAILFLLSSLFACKSFQKTNYEKTNKISKQHLIKQLDEQGFAATTFESRIKITYKDKHQDFTGNGKIKILKDSIIWGSINFMGIPMAKFFITPHQIQYYNKINKEYYKGNFDYIRKEFGINLNFNHLQNLLLGDLIDKIHPENYKLKRKKYYYLLLQTRKNRLDSIKIAPFYKILSEKLSYQKKFAGIEYSNYQKIQDINLPGRIIFSTGDIILKLEYKKPVTGKELRFPFHIPENYQPVFP